MYIPEWFTGWPLWCPPPPTPFWMTISRHFRSICNFFLSFSQNSCRQPFWMTENHFRSHFSPFQINTQLFLFILFTKWLPAAILDDHKSLSIAFLAIFRSIRNFCFSQNGCRCNRLRCPLARMSGPQCFNMGHSGHGINLYGVSMTLMYN